MIARIVPRLKKLVIISISLVFIFAATEKALFSSETRKILLTLGFSIFIARIVVYLLIVAEFLCAFLLLSKHTESFGKKVAYCLFAVFNAYLILLLTTDHPAGCGCGFSFKLFENERANIGLNLVRNIFFYIALRWSFSGSKPTESGARVATPA